MLEATTDRPAPSYRALKFRLDPTAAQRQNMARSAGAARVAYNMLVSYNTKRDKAYEARRTELLAGGMTPIQATAQLKEERKTNPDLVVLGAFAYDTQYLTPERTRHKDAAAALARGETLETVWSDPRYDTPLDAHHAPSCLDLWAAQRRPGLVQLFCLQDRRTRRSYDAAS